jgi:phospholipase/carboxylesterase
MRGSGADGPGRLTARPARAASLLAPGIHTVDTGGRPALLAIPTLGRPDDAVALAVVFHGGGGNASRSLGYMLPVVERLGLAVLVPEAERGTWDAVRGGFGPDVQALDRALATTFGGVTVDPARLAAVGFSDGAMYALSIGLANGDLFSHLVAYSPGFVTSEPRVGQPRVFVAHGTRDEVLPIDRCGRRVVTGLRAAGFDVTYREFDGPHTVPHAISDEALAWFSGPGPATAAGS